MKVCESCSMPMTEKEHYGGGNTDSAYCVHCTDESGTLKSYDDILRGFTDYLVRAEGVSAEEGKKIAAGIMGTLPAWKGKHGNQGGGCGCGGH